MPSSNVLNSEKYDLPRYQFLSAFNCNTISSNQIEPLSYDDMLLLLSPFKVEHL